METTMAADGTSGRRRRRAIRWALVAVVVGLVLLKAFVIDVYAVPQKGMLPTIAPGARFLAWKHPYRDAAQVRRGDIIIFRRRLRDGQSYQFIWRVIGLPGDRVQVAGDAVSINGKPLAREALRRTPDGLTIYREHDGDAAYEVAYPTPAASIASAAGGSQPDVTLTVAPGEFFTLGDNRHNARDSRYDGTVAFEQIIAKKM